VSTIATGLNLYSRTADDAAAAVIHRYSTSFGLATRLLGPRPRPHVRNIYALVRIADEIVDGPAHDAGLSPAEERSALDALENEVREAIASGFSANLIVHAFARSARECGIGDDLIAPFFASMRTDLDTVAHDDASHDAYVFGSAEVVGLMCLLVFLNAGMSAPARPAADLADGARRMGAAFQDVNFLRDLDDDAARLGRDYLDGAAGDERRTSVLDRIDADLAAAAATVPFLPPDCRRAVTAAHDLFAELSRRLRRSPAGAPRVRVPDGVKVTLAARAFLGRPPRGAHA
jgi:phytoene/squalene synthetase